MSTSFFQTCGTVNVLRHFRQQTDQTWLFQFYNHFFVTLLSLMWWPTITGTYRLNSLSWYFSSNFIHTTRVWHIELRHPTSILACFGMGHVRILESLYTMDHVRGFKTIHRSPKCNGRGGLANSIRKWLGRIHAWKKSDLQAEMKFRSKVKGFWVVLVEGCREMIRWKKKLPQTGFMMSVPLKVLFKHHPFRGFKWWSSTFFEWCFRGTDTQSRGLVFLMFSLMNWELMCGSSEWILQICKKKIEWLVTSDTSRIAHWTRIETCWTNKKLPDFAWPATKKSSHWVKSRR